MTSFKITKTVAEKKLGDDFVSLAGGELFTSFDSYPLDLKTETIYFKAPKQYSYNQMASYGGQLDYLIRYSGYEMGKKITTYIKLSRSSFQKLISFFIFLI